MQPAVNLEERQKGRISAEVNRMLCSTPLGKRWQDRIDKIFALTAFHFGEVSA
jgi:hypothetical protein